MVEAVTVPERAAPPGDAPTPNHRLLDALLVGVTLASAVAFFFITSHGTWTPLYERPELDSRFFLAQAHAILRGHLSVKPSQLPFECFVHNGKCYGYFGVTPSLLRIPFLPLLDSFKQSMTPLFISSALTLATASILATLRHLLIRVDLGGARIALVAIGAIGLGPASVLMLVARPAAYEEAIAWAVGFMCLAIYYFLRWWEEQRICRYLGILVSLVLSANARPTAIAFAVIIGLGIAYRLGSNRGRDVATIRKLVLLSGTVMALPLLTCVGVFLVKFGQPLPSFLLDEQVGGRFAAPWWIHIRKLDHNQLQSLRFVPTALYAYFRPDTVVLDKAFPWVDFRFRTAFVGFQYHPAPITYVALTKGSLYVESVSSLTATMPLAFLGAVYSLGIAARSVVRGRQPVLLRIRSSVHSLSWHAIVIMAAGGSFFVTLTNSSISDRYLADAYPLMALLAVSALAQSAERFLQMRVWTRALVGTLVVVGVSWQLLVNIGLEYRTWW